MVFVYGCDSPNFEDLNSTNYCDKSLYLFSFWLITITIIVYAILFMLLLLLSLFIWLILIPIAYMCCIAFSRCMKSKINDMVNKINNFCIRFFGCIGNNGGYIS